MEPQNFSSQPTTIPPAPPTQVPLQPIPQTPPPPITTPPQPNSAVPPSPILPNPLPGKSKFSINSLLMIALVVLVAAIAFYFWQANTTKVIPLEQRLQAPLSVLESQSSVQPISIVSGESVKVEELPISLKFLEKDGVEIQAFSATSSENKVGYKINFIENKPVDIYHFYQEFVEGQQFEFIDGFYNKIAGLINMENEKYLLRIKESSLSESQTEVSMLLISK